MDLTFAFLNGVMIAAPVEEPVKEEVKKEPVKGAYVPPSRRNMASQPDVKDQSWKYGSNRRVDPRRPPEISSEIAFPTLQASADSSNKRYSVTKTYIMYSTGYTYKKQSMFGVLIDRVIETQVKV